MLLIFFYKIFKNVTSLIDQESVVITLDLIFDCVVFSVHCLPTLKEAHMSHCLSQEQGRTIYLGSP